MNAAQAVSLLRVTIGARYELVGRLHGGETGAHEVIGPRGQRLVVKWDTTVTQLARRHGVTLSERLRTVAGWPVPRQQMVDTPDCLFVLQEFMDGVPVEMLGHPVVDRLLELHAGRLGMARPGDPSGWPAALLETLQVGGHGYCRHDSLRRHDGRTAALVERIEDFGHSIGPGDLVGHDVVHWDLHPGNLLEHHSGLSAIVDTDFTQVGDAACDLVLLALTSLSMPCAPGVRRRLSAVAFDDLEDLPRRAYLGHYFIRLLDWSIRGGRPHEVDFWLTQASRMLDV